MINRLNKTLLLGVSPFVLFALTAPAIAQSTASQAVETVVVTSSQAGNIGGLFKQDDIAKTRSTIDSSYIKTQVEGQSVIAETNLLPGVNITNNDSYGATGADIRIRGYDKAHISVTLDGIPLNDTGNYQVYIGEYQDAEIVSRVTINSGTTDVDSPTASATGGTINIVTMVPSDTASITGVASGGSFNYQRESAVIQTGDFGPWGTKAFLQASYMEYDKFKGLGSAIRRQYNGRIYQDIGSSGDFISLAFNWDPNLIHSLQSNSKATFAANPSADYNPTCVRYTNASGHAVTGTSDVEATCNSYYGVKINPSQSGNVRMQSLFTLATDLKLTFDPYVQYVLANGGGTAVINENDPRLRGNTGQAGVDLNGDGDLLDKVNVYNPSNTETRRWGVTSSLLWTPANIGLFQFSATSDYGLHRQTAQNQLLTQGTNTPQVISHYGGADGAAVYGADGLELRQRDRKSKAILNQAAVDYEGDWFDNTLHVSAGVRAPFFERDLNQYCYTVEKAGTPGSAGTGPALSSVSPNSSTGQYCTSQTPNTVVNPAGIPAGTYVQFAGGTAIFDAPYHAVKDYNRILPNVGLSYKPFGDEHQFYAAYAQTLSSPITDDLYATPRIKVVPETATSYDAGYRYTGDDGLIAEADVWHSVFFNHIVSSYNEADNYTLDTNVGAVLLSGADASLGYRFSNLSLYGTASWETTKLKQNLQTSAATILPTAGKQLVETPDWMFSFRAQYDARDYIQGLLVGADFKYVGRRWSTDVNDERTSPYTVVNADVSYDLEQWGWKDMALKFNVTNLFDRTYLGSISSTNTAAGTPFYYLGAPRTFVGSLSVKL